MCDKCGLFILCMLSCLSVHTKPESMHFGKRERKDEIMRNTHVSVDLSEVSLLIYSLALITPP